MSATVRTFVDVLYVLLRNNDGEVKVPQHVLDAIARDFLPDILAAFGAMSDEYRQMDKAHNSELEKGARQSTSVQHKDQPQR